MSEQEQDKKYPLTQQIGFGTGALFVAGATDALAHLGPTGLVVGGIAAFIVSQAGPEIYGQVRERIASSLPHPAPLPPSRNGKRSIIDRAIGRFPGEMDEPTTEPVSTRGLPARAKVRP
ncbi:MAG TPA: hypothetical protein VGN34_15815, partial [Ktedonobacteraceae bacterium]